MTRRRLLRALGFGGVAVGFGGVTAVVDPERALWVLGRKQIFLPPTTRLTAAWPDAPTTIPVYPSAEDRQVGIRMRYLKEWTIETVQPPQYDLFNPKANLAVQYRAGVLSRKSGLFYDEWDVPPYGYSSEAKAAWDAEIKKCARRMADQIDAEIVHQILRDFPESLMGHLVEDARVWR